MTAVGHHVQNLLGILSQVQGAQRKTTHQAGIFTCVSSKTGG
jgi:predicted metalloprotease